MTVRIAAKVIHQMYLRPALEQTETVWFMM